MSETRSWREFAIPWLLWTLITTVGVPVGLGVMAASGMSAAMYDPDEVAAFMNTSLAERLVRLLFSGAILGLVFGLVAGAVRWLLGRRVRDALVAAALTLAGTILSCVIVGTGGPSQLQDDTAEALRYGFAGGLVSGAVIGIGQWLVLRARLSRVEGWATLSTLLWAGAWAAGAAAWGLNGGGTLHAALSVLAILALAALVGAGQWLILRRNLEQAGWWIAGQAGAVALAMGVIALLGLLPGTGEWAPLAAGAILGGGTGAVVLALHPRQHDADPAEPIPC